MPAWQPVDAETGKIRDLAGMEALAKAFPDSSSVRLRLLNAQLEAGDGAAMLDTLRWLNARGYVFGEVARGQIPKLIGEEFAATATQLLLPPTQPVERSEVVWTIPAKAGLIESLIVDVENDRMAATSVTTRSLWGVTPQGDWRDVAPAGSDNLSGIVYDRETHEIWVASGNVDQSQDEKVYFSGLISALHPQERRFAAPSGVTLSDLHYSGDGTIFAADPIKGGLYFLGPERESIETLIAPGLLRSPQGSVTSADGTRLYVSDYRYGIAIVDLASGAISRLASNVPVMLDGIDALFRKGNALIAIQNGVSPMRISQFNLSGDGTRVTGHAVLERAHREWTEPLGGYLGETALYYVGNGQWDKYVAGQPAEGREPDPVQIRRLPLD